MIDLSPDAVAFLENFGEPVTYTPKGKSPVTILAIVERQPLQLDSMGGTPWPVDAVPVWIAANDDDGVYAVTERFDTVELFTNIFDLDPTLHTVQKIVKQDIGMYLLAVKR